MNMKTLLLALASLFVASVAWAVPSQLAHQGRLLDTEGAALTGEHALTFALFDAETEGSEVWSETITVNIVGGFYSVVLGADEETNPLDDLVLSNPPLWLELTVDDGEPLLPRHELLSVPYAVLAGTATNVEGGYVDASEVAVDGATVIDASGNWVGSTPAVDWSDLSGVPAGLDDGVDADTLGGLSCADGGIPVFEIATNSWVCGSTAAMTTSDVVDLLLGATVDLGLGSSLDGVSIATLDDLDWSLLGGIPPGLADGLDADSLVSLALSCPDGGRPAWDTTNSVWTCTSTTWTELQAIPADLADGDADALGGLACANGGIAVFVAASGAWVCGADMVLSDTDVLSFVDGATLDLGPGSTLQGVDLATVDDITWGSLLGVPPELADGLDADSLAALGVSCGDGARPVWDATSSLWACTASAWAELQGVPSDLADGDADALGGLACANGGIAVFLTSTNTWTCGADSTLSDVQVLGYVTGATLDLGAGSTVNGAVIATLADLTWGSLGGIPAELADGLDADTLAGLTCLDGARPRWDLGTGLWVCDQVAWSEVQNIPADLADGDADSLGGLVACADGGVAKFNLGTGLWECGPDLVLGATEVLSYVDGSTIDLGILSSVNGVSIATTADLTWSMLTGVPAGLADGVDADSLAGLTCADGARPRWDLASGLWACDAVGWAEIQNIPSDISDGDADTLGGVGACADGGVAKYNLGTGQWNCGTDSVLTSGDVLGFVGGSVLALGAGSSMGGSTLATLSSLTWGSLSGVPADLADGDADTLAGLSCADGGVAKFNLGTGLWACGTDLIRTSSEVLGFVDGAMLDLGIGSTVNGVTVATVADLDWSGLTGVPIDFLDGDDADTLAALGVLCNDGDRPAWDSTLSDWTCAPEQVDLDRLDSSAATSGQVLTYDGTNVAWEDPAAPTNSPCTLTLLDEPSSYAEVACGATQLFLRTSMSFSQISSSGSNHTCGVRSNGTVLCWGQGTYGETTPPAGTFTQVSAGNIFTCGVSTSGSVLCWGTNSSGQSTPPAGTFTQVSAGGTHACAVSTSGSVQCWGNNSFGQSTPPAGTFTQVSAGQGFTCGVTSGGLAQCWGTNSAGQSTPPAGTYFQVSAGSNYACGLRTNGSVRCWGVLGNGGATPLSGTFVQVGVGTAHTCGLRASGLVQCWGQNASGETNPQPGTFFQISAGSSTTCGLRRANGPVACWGSNSIGQSSPP